MSWFHLRDFKRALTAFILCGAIAIAVTSPWIARTYSHYPDWRVAKSFGFGLTHEWLATITEARAAWNYRGIDKRRKDRIIREMANDSRDLKCIEKSFDGSYAKRKANLAQSFDEPYAGAMFFQKAKRQILENTFSIHYYGRAIDRRVASWVAMLAIVGIVLWYRRLYPILMPLTTFVCCFFLFSSEDRRLIPVAPFLLMFSCLAIWTCFQLARHGLPAHSGLQLLRPTTSPNTVLGVAESSRVSRDDR